MASTTLNALSLSTTAQPTVGASVRELLVAGKHLAAALWYTAFTPAAQSSAQTAFEEAEALRSFAATVQRSDPEFARDLFAAADRHEAA